MPMPVIRACALSLAVSALPAAAGPLAPFVLKAAGPLELKLSGYLARSSDAGGPGALKESSFGAGYLTGIHELANPSNVLWRPGQDNQSISYMMYGAADAGVVHGAGGMPNLVYGAGCTHAAFGCDGKIHLDFYLDQLAGGTNPGFGVGGIKASQRQGFDRLGGITDGQLLMRWEFVPGLAEAGTAALPVTLHQQLNGTTSPSPGAGSFLARCASGPACSYFANGSQQAGSDFLGMASMAAVLGLTAIGQNGWMVRQSQSVVAQVGVPLPNSALLLPLGLLAMAGVRRCQRGA